MPSKIEQLKAYLESNIPAASGLWNYSTNNQLSADWLLATPTAVWGKPYRDFKMAVKGSYPDFELETCIAADGPTQSCEIFPATVKGPGQDPAKLLVGHSDRLVEAVYDVMTSAEKIVDVTLLSEPTGRFLAAMRNAITFLSRKPAAKRPIVRVIYSNSPDVRAKATGLLGQLVRDLDTRTPMNIFACVLSSAINSWNHSKIIAADGVRSIVGGHNLWSPQYLDANPVFDVSMQVEGDAALHAHDYADALWRFLLDTLDRKWPWPTSTKHSFNSAAGYVLNRATNSYAPDENGRPAADVYTKIRSQLGRPATGSVPVLSVGRRGAMNLSAFLPTDQSYLYSYEQEPSDLAINKLVALAQSKIRMCQHAMSFRLLNNYVDPEAYTFWYWSWNYELFREIGEALQRGVDVTLTVSNPGATAGNLWFYEFALYTGDYPYKINQYMLGVLKNYLGVEEVRAKGLIRDRFHVASFRYSSEDSYPLGNTAIPNHAKTLIVDDRIFYIGSQNLYKCDLNEFGYIVEDPAIARSYLDQYWLPLWEQASRTIDTTYSDDLVKEMEGEALLFVLELRRNKRLANTWQETLQARADKTSPEEIQQTAIILNDIIANAGFYTTSNSVLNVLQSPFFTTIRDQTVSNNEARRFVTDLMSKRDLLKAFVQLVESQKDATDPDADAAITRFVQQNGYGCTAIQVAAAMDELRNEMFVAWLGVFGSWVKPDGGTSYSDFGPKDELRRRAARTLLSTDDDEAVTIAEGPALTVLGNTRAKLGNDELKNIQFRNGVLSWDTASGNKTSGSITFSQITQPGLNDPYVGYECFGAVTWPADGAVPERGTVSYYARWDKSINVDEPDQPVSFPWPVAVIISLVGLIAAAATAGVLIRRSRVRLQRERDYILEHMDEFEPVNAEGSSEWNRLKTAFEEGKISPSEFKTKARDLAGREEFERIELDEIPDRGRRRLQSFQWELEPPAPDQRDGAVETVKSSLSDMLAVQEEQLGAIVRYGVPDEQFEDLVASVSGLRDQVQEVSVETSGADLNRLFQRLSKTTTSVNDYVRTTAEAKARADNGWIETARKLDAQRVEWARRANDTRDKIDAIDKDNPSPDSPDEEFNIPEERIDLPEFVE
jgi:phosphatidylserine/phosphatidylglycerophosphate/cardiolipin synthase-like enzyme